LDHKSTTPVTVEVHTEDGTASALQDYQAINPFTVTIPAGDTSAKLDIPIISDTTFESDETFFIRLSNPQGAELNDSTATVTILNDDKSALTVASEAISITEGDKINSSAKVVVSLPAPVTTIVTVDYKTLDGTATSAGATPDFKSTSGTLTFQVGQTSQTISIPILDDTSVENNENFKVVLSNPKGVSMGSSNSTTITIIDNDGVVTKPILSIDPTTVSVGEGAGSAQLKVSLSAAATSDVTAIYDLVDGSAKVGSDFTGASKQTLTFKTGETSKTILVPITEDTLVEGDETFNVVLSNAVGANLGTNISAKVTVIDNDKANQAPTAGDDSYQSLSAGTAFTKALSELLSNDKDADGGTLSVAAVSNAVGGSVALDSSKTNVTFTPTDANVTSGSFQYTLSDGQGGTANAIVNLGFKSAPVNKAPVAVNDSYQNLTAGVALSKPVTELLANDSDADGGKLALTGVNNAVGGTISLDASKANFTFTPTNASTTVGSFQYALSDGQGGTASAIVNLTFAVSSSSNNKTLTMLPADTRTYDVEIPLTESDDILNGSPINEKFLGLGGKDKLDAKDGENYLDGGLGNDTLIGGKGNDYILGGDGDDSIEAGGGNNSIDGGLGNDKIIDNNAGDNLIIDNFGDNDIVISGQKSSQKIISGIGNDRIEVSLNGGSITLDSGSGNDGIDIRDQNSVNVVVDSGNGDDVLYVVASNAGAVMVHSGSGNDKITSYVDVYGDSGDDDIEVNRGAGYGGDGDDRLAGRAWDGSILLLQGDNGNDTLTNSGRNKLYGGLGNDTIITNGLIATIQYYNTLDSGVGIGNRDIVTDFNTSSDAVFELYHLSDKAFNYLGVKNFDGTSNSVRFNLDVPNKQTIIQIDMNGDKAPDMEIELTGINILSVDDFVLKAPV
jgi:hypothetical protein